MRFGAGSSIDAIGSRVSRLRRFLIATWLAFGAEYHFTRSLAVRLEWQRYNDVGAAATTGRFDVDTYGIGAVLSF